MEEGEELEDMEEENVGEKRSNLSDDHVCLRSENKTYFKPGLN